MDWGRDDAALGDADLSKVFKYASRTTTVLHMLRRNQVRVLITGRFGPKTLP